MMLASCVRNSSGQRDSLSAQESSKRNHICLNIQTLERFLLSFAVNEAAIAVAALRRATKFLPGTFDAPRRFALARLGNSGQRAPVGWLDRV
jgi:hypothetical protein